MTGIVTHACQSRPHSAGCGVRASPRASELTSPPCGRGGPLQGAGGGEVEAAAALPERQAPAVPAGGAEGVREAGRGAQEAERYWARCPRRFPSWGCCVGAVGWPLVPECRRHAQACLLGGGACFAASPSGPLFFCSSKKRGRTRAGGVRPAEAWVLSASLPGRGTFRRSPRPSGPGSASIKHVS